MTSFRGLRELQGIARRVSEDGFAPSSEIKPELLRWLDASGDDWCLFDSRKLREILGSRRNGIEKEDTEAVGALDDEIHHLKWEIRYFQLLAWLCGMGVVILVGSIASVLMK